MAAEHGHFEGLPEPAPEHLLDVLSSIDLFARKHFIAWISTPDALALRATCQLGRRFVDPLFSAPILLKQTGLRQSEDRWQEEVDSVLAALPKTWPGCSQLELSALVHPEAKSVGFVANPCLAPACGWALPQITQLTLHVDVAQLRNAEQQQRHRSSSPQEQQQRVVIFGPGAAGGSSSGPLGIGPEDTPTPSITKGSATSPVFAVTLKRGAVAPLELTSALTGSLVRLFPSLEALYLMGHWSAPRSPAPPRPQPARAQHTWVPASSHTLSGGGGGGGCEGAPQAATEPFASPLAPLTRLPGLHTLGLPEALCKDERAVAAVGLADLSHKVRHLFVRTDQVYDEGPPPVRIFVDTLWPRALLAAVPRLQELTLVGGCSGAIDLLEPNLAAPEPSPLWARPQPPRPGPSSYQQQQHQRDAPAAALPHQQLLRLCLIEHIAYTPELLMLQKMVADLRTGSLELRASPDIPRLAACIGAFEDVAHAAAEDFPATAVAAVRTELAAVAPGGPRQPRPQQLPGQEEDPSASGSASASTSAAGSADVPCGTLRSVVVSNLQLYSSPREEDWAVLEGFAARPGCSFTVEEVIATYPECGSGNPRSGRAAGGVSGSSSAGNGGSTGPGSSQVRSPSSGTTWQSTLHRALALSANPCRRVELRVPAGDAMVLQAAITDLGRLPQHLLPKQVEVKMMVPRRWGAAGNKGAARGVGRDESHGENEDGGNGGGSGGSRGRSPLAIAAAAVAAEAAQYPHLRNAVRLAVHLSDN